MSSVPNIGLFDCSIIVCSNFWSVFKENKRRYPELIEGGLRLEELLLLVERLAGEDIRVLVVHLHVRAGTHRVRVEDGFRFGHWK